jgi:hypothetical protein
MGLDDEIARGVFRQPLDLEPIKARLRDGKVHPDDPAQLIEEVERLRAQNKRLHAIVGVP